MNARSRTLLALSFVAAYVLATSPVHATLATASLDWSKLDIFSIGIPSHTRVPHPIAGQTTSWSASATSVNNSSDDHKHSSFNWTTALDLTSDTPNANGEANGSATLFSARASAKDSISGDPTQTNSASATLERRANIAINGPTAIILSVPFSLTQDGTDFQHHAIASISGSAAFTPNGSFTVTDNTTREITLDSGLGSVSTLNGMLVFGLVLDTPGNIALTFDASTSATAPDPIPEPSVAFLEIAGGLMAIGAILRRRSGRRR